MSNDQMTSETLLVASAIAKHQVMFIEIVRAEGPGELTGNKHRVESFAEANLLLGSWRIPEATHADKCDFKVVWGDDESTEYTGTYFLEHANNAQSLNAHIQNTAEINSGATRPHFWNDEEWRRHLIRTEPYRHEVKRFLDNFKLE